MAFLLLIRHIKTMNFVIPGLTRNPAMSVIGVLCTPLDTGLRRYDVDSIYLPNQ